MPQILIVTDSPENPGEVVYRESVTAVHLASAHSSDQLVERLAWAIGDAALAERRARQARPSATRNNQGLRAA
jgi:hypothetical protein